MIQQVLLDKLSIRHLMVLRNVLDSYGAHLIPQWDDDRTSDKRLKYSICQEVFLKLDKKLTLEIQMKPRRELEKCNKRWSITVHASMIILDAIFYYSPDKADDESPSLEYFKTKISKQLL